MSCTGSSIGKMPPQPEATATLSRSNRPLQRIFIDLSGPRLIASKGGALYLMIDKDDVLWYAWTGWDLSETPWPALL